MKEGESIQDFTLFGGPLQRLGRRLGLVRGHNSFRLGLTLGLVAWGFLALLALLQDVDRAFFSLTVLGVHVRFLVAIPLLFLCETWVGPRMAEFVRDLARFGIVPESGRAELAAVVRRIERLKDPWLVECLFLMAVLLLHFLEPVAQLPGLTASRDMLRSESDGRGGLVLGWYLWFCLPLFRFLWIRWLWHLVLWWYLLWRVQKLDLHLAPTHPDRAAGLGFLEIVHEQFAAFAFAISAVLAAAYAEDLAVGAMAFESLYLLIPMGLLVVAALFIAPLLIFTPRLWACRVSGWRDYMGLGSRYVQAFDRRWIRGDAPSGESLLGTADLQSLADLSSSVDVVRELRWAPVSRRLVVILVAAALLPMLPLVLFKYPAGQLAAKLFQTLTGL